MTSKPLRHERDINTVAAVDLGSNSFHLVLARFIDQDVQILHREKQKVKLASGLDENNVLDEEAMQRGLKALSYFADTLQGFPLQNVRVVATYSLRTAINANTFISRAADIFPYPIEVISGQEEARLIYQGVANSVHSLGQRLVIDIGGGSTELVIGEAFTPIAQSSRNVGCVSLTDKYFADGAITAEAFQQAILLAQQELEPILEKYQSLGWQHCFGTSGAVKSICDIHEAEGMSDGSLTLSSLKALQQRVQTVDHIDQVNLNGLAEDRRSILCGGLAILLAAFDMFNIKRMRFADKALREGVLYQMVEHDEQGDIRERAVNSLATRFDTDTAHASRVEQTAMSLFDQVKTSWQLNGSPELKLLLKWACQLHEVGLHINASSVHRHSAYIIANSPLSGFNVEQQNILAALVRMYRKKVKLHLLPQLTNYKAPQVHRLLAIFRLASLLSQKRQDQYLPQYSFSAKDNACKLTLPQQWLTKQALLKADLENEIIQLQKLGIELSVN
ncbi:exopolyphosphatase [Flocculibacter collagenilyticus]|uniref:exopolyphosphatase n=1 Tax=Flocculibacter collagenilyticus TaxID=2744479 RepID=UPI0018F3F924|nr:exopolyphosphatase [Flocculibacter collagenilyticus]